MHEFAWSLVGRLEDDAWTRLGVPGFDVALTRTKLGETYDIDLTFLLTDDHRYDARSAAKQLLEWVKSHRPWRTTALLAVVFDGAHTLDIENITPISEAGWHHRVVARSALIDFAGDAIGIVGAANNDHLGNIDRSKGGNGHGEN